MFFTTPLLHEIMCLCFRASRAGETLVFMQGWVSRCSRETFRAASRPVRSRNVQVWVWPTPHFSLIVVSQLEGSNGVKKGLEVHTGGAGICLPGCAPGCLPGCVPGCAPQVSSHTSLKNGSPRPSQRPSQRPSGRLPGRSRGP